MVLNFISMTTDSEITSALIQFINERPVGNMLRDIAERTLKDYLRRTEVRVFPEMNEQRFVRPKPISSPVVPREHSRVNRAEVNVYAKKNLKRLRNRAQMHQVDFAKRFEVDAKNLHRYETGENSVPVDLAINVCRAFSIELELFLTELV